MGADTVLTSVVYLNNGTVGSYDGFFEGWMTNVQDKVASGLVKVLHQVKISGSLFELRMGGGSLTSSPCLQTSNALNRHPGN